MVAAKTNSSWADFLWLKLQPAREKEAEKLFGQIFWNNAFLNSAHPHLCPTPRHWPLLNLEFTRKPEAKFGAKEHLCLWGNELVWSLPSSQRLQTWEAHTVLRFPAQEWGTAWLTGKQALSSYSGPASVNTEMNITKLWINVKLINLPLLIHFLAQQHVLPEMADSTIHRIWISNHKEVQSLEVLCKEEVKGKKER